MAAKVLSDLFALGMTKIYNFLMLLGISLKMNEEEKDIVTKEMIKGYNFTC